MNTLFSRIKRRWTMTYKNFQSDCQFSIKLALLRLVDELGGRIGFRKAASKAHTAKDEWISAYLKKQLLPVIDDFRNMENIGIEIDNAPIWVCWWSGEDSAPELVKKCIQSIRDKANGHPVNLIDKNNYSEYISIPDYIFNKVSSGQMNVAHFSDYLRVSLICKHGGLWLDATIFCTQDIKDEYFSLPFFTCKSSPIECVYISKMRWTSFVLGGWKNNVFFLCMKSLFELYWSLEDSAIDYLTFDYLIDLSYSEIDGIKKLIDNVPINNIHRDDLQAAMNRRINASDFNKIIQKDTDFYKLSWRENYSLTTPEGNESIYAYYLTLP